MNFKKLLLFSLFTLVSTAYSATITDSTSVTPSELAERIIKEASKYIGTRYKYGGTGNYGFDCSGFTSTVYNKFGYRLEHSSRGQAKQGKAITGPISNLQKGDLVFFAARRKSKTIGHVGIFISLDKTGEDFTFIHSSTTNGVIVSHLKEPYYDGKFLEARRIIPDFVQSDTASKAYSFDIDNTYIKPDTLELKEQDIKIILLEDGKWAYIDKNNQITKPDGEEKIVLDPVSGNWNRIANSKKLIPSTAGVSIASSSKASTTSNSSAASSTSTNVTGKTDSKNSSTSQANNSENESEEIYHTIKSGDSLYALAKKYHTTVKSICTLNRINEKTILKLGKKLRIK